MPSPRRRRFRSTLKSWLPPALRSSAKVVRVVRLQGMIGRIGPVGSGMSLESVSPMLQAAFEDDDAAAVALVINSPGGSAAQSHLIFRRIRDHAAESGKPVLAFVEDAAASGGYMIACAADEIFADPSSIVGSIGVVSGGFGFVGAIARLGIERRVHTAGESKAMLDPFLPEKPEEVARLRALQSDIHAHFIALVRERRGERLREQEPLFTGAFWTGARARDLGLIDGLGEIRSTLRARFGEDVRFRRTPARRGLSLARLFGAAAAQAPDAALSIAEERGLWSRYGL